MVDNGYLVSRHGVCGPISEGVVALFPSRDEALEWIQGELAMLLGLEFDSGEPCHVGEYVLQQVVDGLVSPECERLTF